MCDVLIIQMCVLTLLFRPDPAHTHCRCEDTVEFPLFDDGEILQAVPCHSGCSHGPTATGSWPRRTSKAGIMWLFNMAYLKLGGLVRASYGENGHWWFQEGRGVWAANACAVHIHPLCLKWHKSNLCPSHPTEFGGPLLSSGGDLSRWRFVAISPHVPKYWHLFIHHEYGRH